MDLMMEPISFITSAISDTDSFFQELREISEAFVRRSLMQYIAYELKTKDSEAYIADPAANIPFLKREAQLRGLTLDEMVQSVSQRKEVLHSIVREYELLRVEFNLRYKDSMDYAEKLALRDELLAKAKKLVESVPA